MSIACNCDCDYGYDSDWWYYPPNDYTMMGVPGRRKRCYCCREFIKPLSMCARFERARAASEIEEAICGDVEWPLADAWLCEECADLYWSVTEQGFCVMLERRPMREQVREAMEDWR